MEQFRKTSPKSTVYGTCGSKPYNFARMSTNTDKVPDNQLNSPIHTRIKDKSNEKKMKHPTQDHNFHHPQDNKMGQQDEANHKSKVNENEENEHCQDNNYRFCSSGKESIGEGSVENPEILRYNMNEDMTYVVENPTESELSNYDAVNDDIDNNLPSTTILLTTPGGSKVYVVGTVHYSLQSQDDVAKVIRAVQPNYVVLELCPTRSVMLQWDEETVFKQAQNMSFSEAVRKSFQLGFLEGLFFITLFSLSVRMTKQLGIAPGGEFRTAFREAQQVPNCQVLFGDLPFPLTLMRLFSILSFWQVVKIVTSFLFQNKKMSQEEVENYRKMDEVEKMLLEFSKESPEIAKVMVNERDAALTYSMQIMAETNEPNKVVGVVGLGHLLGIKENWGKVTEAQIREIMKVPPPRRYHRVIKYTLKFTAVGLVLYGVHKIASKSSFYDRLFSDESYWSLSNIVYDIWDSPVIHS